MQRSTDVGGIARGPRAFEPRATGLAMTGLGERPLPAALTAGVCCGGEPQDLHQWPGVIEAREVAEFSDGGDGPGGLDAAQGLERVGDRLSTPGGALAWPLLRETAQAFRVFVDRTDRFLKDHVRGRGGTDGLSQPAEGGRAPRGLARVADIVPE